MIIPHNKLSEEALRGMIEAFIHREGTDYGEREVSLTEKVAQLRTQLDDGLAIILFDPRDESFTIVRHDAGEIHKNIQD